METIDLEIIKRAVQGVISKEFLWEGVVDVADSPMFDQIVVRITRPLVALRAKEEVTTESEEIAVGWWDHLILSFSARFVDLDAGRDERQGFWWALRRRATTRSVVKRSIVYYACPHVDVPIDTKRHIRWLQSADDYKKLLVRPLFAKLFGGIS